MDIFKVVIKELTSPLKQISFSKKGDSFYQERDKNYGILNFQKSRSSIKELVSFTLNFGIYSSVLAESLAGRVLTKPKVEDCHWRARVGAFMPGQPDHWWSLSASDSLVQKVNDIMNVINSLVVPEINKRISDDGLIKEWMEGGYAGTTEIGRFVNLTTLLKAKGDIDVLNSIAEQFMQLSKGKPNESRAKEHLTELGFVLK